MIQSLQKFQVADGELSRVQENVERFTTPLVKNPQLDGVLLQKVSLAQGSTDVPHKLGRPMTGWSIERVRSAAEPTWAALTLTSPWASFVDTNWTYPAQWRFNPYVGYVQFRGLINATGARPSFDPLFNLPLPCDTEQRCPTFIDTGGVGGTYIVDVRRNTNGNFARVVSATTNPYVWIGNITYFPIVAPNGSGVTDQNDTLSNDLQSKFLRLVSPRAMVVDLWVY